MATIKANGNLNGDELKDIVVVNPGDWFGKTWLVEIAGSYSPHYLVIEAGSMSDAIDELADSEKHGHHIVVEDKYLADYPEDRRHYGPSGQVLDLDHIMIHGNEGSDTPFPCTYHGDGIPTEGMKPTDFCWDEIES